jgi:hypothetical protein
LLANSTLFTLILIAGALGMEEENKGMWIWDCSHECCSKNLFGSAVEFAFDRISNFFFAKIECGLYFLDRFDVLISKMIFKK